MTLLPEACSDRCALLLNDGSLVGDGFGGAHVADELLHWQPVSIGYGSEHGSWSLGEVQEAMAATQQALQRGARDSLEAKEEAVGIALRIGRVVKARKPREC